MCSRFCKQAKIYKYAFNNEDLWFEKLPQSFHFAWPVGKLHSIVIILTSKFCFQIEGKSFVNDTLPIIAWTVLTKVLALDTLEPLSCQSNNCEKGLHMFIACSSLTINFCLNLSYCEKASCNVNSSHAFATQIPPTM